MESLAAQRQQCAQTKSCVSGLSISSAYGAEFAGSVFEKYATAIKVTLARIVFVSVSLQLELFISLTLLAERR